MSKKKVYLVFTVDNRARDGAVVGTFHVGGANVDIPAIVIGESGRGRKLGILPVHLPPELYQEWREKGQVDIVAASIGETRSGKPKLYAERSANSTDAAIVVFRTHIGFRGSNDHTGDRVGWKCEKCGHEEKFAHPAQGMPDECPACGADKWALKLLTAPFPGEVLVEGRIAQGIAGRMGSGRQIIAIIPRNVVVRTAYSGRLYGTPPAHYHRFDGEKIVSLTLAERQVSDIF